MAGLYLVGAWLLTQVAGTVLPMFGAPEWLPRSIVILLAIGFIPALIFSWVFELTPEGLKRDEDVPPEQSIAPQTARRMDRMIIVVLLLALGYFAVDKFVLAPRRAAAPNELSFAAGAKSIAVLPFENLERRQGERLLCRRNSGRNSHEARQHCRPQSHLANLDGQVQEQAGGSEDRFTTVGCRHRAGGICAKGCRQGPRQRAAHRRTHGYTPLGEEL